MTEKLPKVKISSFEIDQNRAVASIETVRHFKDEDDDIYFIIGADNLASLRQWNSFETLDQMVTWVVATRGDIKIPEQYQTLKVDHDISATQLREQVQEAYLDKNIAKEIITYYKDISLKK
jgi:nicotinate-nucleotide adenylyltransferase